ncbi:Protein kinase domain [Macleaya cordata]|uniref:Protein kinase domain n=1 Tax=Macleaya cordata TaxID=56857 RepID=A0A200Q286_MACCD|nr:Protein kinase domain [Macleaya cordata]
MDLLQSIISLYIVSLIISYSSPIYAQQPYVRKATTDCQNTDNSTSVLGYSCNGQSPSCQAYLIFRSLPPYNTVSSISKLLASDPSQLSQLNSVSETSTFQTNKEVIVPINCSCSGKYYQTNSSYVIEDNNTYLLIANDTYQGLSTCQALQDQNNLLTRNLFTGTRITVPLRCACPTKNQTDNGVKYLLSYIVTWGDFVSSISERFGVDTGRTLEANELSEQDATVYPFTTLLVPLQNPPSSSQTIVPPPPPSPSPPPPPPSDKKKKTWVYVIVGVVAASVSVLVVSIVILCLCIANTKRSKADPNIISESFDSYEKPQEKKPGEEYNEFLNNISDIAQSLKVYKFEELQSATENFSPNWWIKGSVYQGIINGNLAAIKKMNGDVSKELNVLNKINHFNLIRLSGVCFSEGHWYLVYEYAVNGSLTDWIFYGTNVRKVLSWTKRVQIALDVATGLNYLHSYTNPSHVHKDIKSSNVLLDSDLRAKIANFGLARSAEGKEGEFASTRHIVGTKGYMAPEYLENGLVSPKLDVYSFGVVMLEIVTGREQAIESGAKDVLSSDTLVAILAKENPNEKLKNFIDPSLQENYPLDLAIFVARLIESCLRRDPDGRPSMDEIVQSLTRILAISMTWESSNSASESHSFASASSDTSTWKREN